MDESHVIPAQGGSSPYATPLTHSPQLFSAPGPPSVLEPASDSPLSLASPSSLVPNQTLVPPGTNAVRLRLRDILSHEPHKLHNLSGHGYEGDHLTLDGAQSAGEAHISQREGSECFTDLAPEDTVDDLIRTIDIIKPGDHERTYCAKMLIDSGNHHENLISTKLVDDLRLSRSHRNPSLLRRVMSMLAPWTKTAMATKSQAKSRLRNIDGTLIDGQDGTVTIAWFGENRHDLRDPILYFQPVRYETTHIVVSAANCGADVILSWKEVKSLKLRHRFTGAIQRPPTPKSDPGDKMYQDSEQRKAERKAARDEKRGKGEIQPPGPGNTTQTGR